MELLRAGENGEVYINGLPYGKGSLVPDYRNAGAGRITIKSTEANTYGVILYDIHFSDLKDEDEVAAFASWAALITWIGANFFKAPGAGTGGAWGGITGTIEDQADLTAALATKKRKSTNVFDFVENGGVGDGVTNNDAVFASAIASGKRIVEFGAGTFKYNSTGKQLPAGQIWRGEGDSTIIKWEGNDFGIRLNTDCIVEYIAFEGAGKLAGNSKWYNSGLWAYDGATSGWTVQHCKFSQFAGNNLVGSGPGGGGGIMIVGVGKNKGNRVLDNRFEDNYTGLNLASGEFVTAMANVFTGNKFAYSNKGGNNMLIGGSIVDNEVGIEIDGTGIANDGHGSIVGVFCVHNTVKNLLAKSINNGYQVVGSNLGAGDISIEDTFDFRLQGCYYIGAVNATLTNNTRISSTDHIIDGLFVYNLVSGHSWFPNEYANDAAAIAGLLAPGNFYKTGEFVKVVL